MEPPVQWSPSDAGVPTPPGWPAPEPASTPLRPALRQAAIDASAGPVTPSTDRSPEIRFPSRPLAVCGQLHQLGTLFGSRPRRPSSMSALTIQFPRQSLIPTRGDLREWLRPLTRPPSRRCPRPGGMLVTKNVAALSLSVGSSRGLLARRELQWTSRRWRYWMSVVTEAP